jgi:hypothetical protein
VADIDPNILKNGVFDPYAQSRVPAAGAVEPNPGDLRSERLRSLEGTWVGHYSPQKNPADQFPLELIIDFATGSVPSTALVNGKPSILHSAVLLSMALTLAPSPNLLYDRGSAMSGMSGNTLTTLGRLKRPLGHLLGLGTLSTKTSTSHLNYVPQPHLLGSFFPPGMDST